MTFKREKCADPQSGLVDNGGAHESEMAQANGDSSLDAFRHLNLNDVHGGFGSKVQCGSMGDLEELTNPKWHKQMVIPSLRGARR
jgi:hypothetical protein